MKRRTFLKSRAILSTTMVVNPTFVFANNETNPFGIKEGVRKFSITNGYKLQKSDEVAQLWIPIPLDSDYQKLVDMKFEGNFKEAKIVENEYETKVLYATWEKGAQNPEINVSFEVMTQQKFMNLANAKNDEKYSGELRKYLEPTRHIPVNEKIGKLVADITKDAKTPIQKQKQFMIGQLLLCIETIV